MSSAWGEGGTDEGLRRGLSTNPIHPNDALSHLIADHLSWFKDSHEAKTVEEMVKEKGGRVRTGRKVLDSGEDQGETVEILSDSDADIIEAAREG